MAALPPELRQPFRIIAFDWDGTAVARRDEDVGQLRALLERLLCAGVIIFVVTGTNFANIDRQLSSAVRGAHKRNLLIATNRGSEVYGFDAEYRPVLLHRRVATPEEDIRLTTAALALRDAIVARTGLDIRVIADRLNRRKVDLIPLPEWQDPPKAAFDELLHAVETRLKGAGLDDGLRTVLALAEEFARAQGLADARITSDIKHVEIGLTDKGDAIAWLVRELAQPRGIPAEAILIVGDEFGPVAGFEGSDYKMIRAAPQGVVAVSVGREPAGVPPGVIHLGSGPATFCALIAAQADLHEQRAVPATPGRAGGVLDLPVAPIADPSWLLVDEGFVLAREHEIESLFAVSNGYVGVRGSLPEETRLSSPATYVAGVFEQGSQGGMGAAAVPQLAVAPDWTHLRIVVDGRRLTLEQGEALEHRRVLDLRQGILWRTWRHRDPVGRITRLSFLRLASLADRHVLIQSVILVPENYSARVCLESRSAWPHHCCGASVPPQEPDATAPALVLQRATSRGVIIAVATGGILRAEDGAFVAPQVEQQAGRWLERWEWSAAIGHRYRLDQVAVIYTSRDAARPAEVAAAHRDRVLRTGIERLIAAHRRVWQVRWRETDVRIDGDSSMTQALRFAAYHLIAAAHPEDERVSIGARGLTGAAYKGHVFWDTEIYMFPFYAHTWPEAARALLMYRYHTLPAAREKARRLGYRGALYAWESADTGDETTPPLVVTPSGEVIRIVTGEQAHHISADIAYAVWQYWQVSGDDAFFRDAGAEIVLETARFWASRGAFEADGRYHIRRVIGPDEYHEAVDDNAYTNGMAQWNLERGVETARLLQARWPERWAELAARLELSADDLGRWETMARQMYLAIDPQTGLVEQFEGYFDLEELDLTPFEACATPIDVLLGAERVRRSKVIKQADVVLLLYLLWDRFAPHVREASFRYYEPRTAHGSSLSPAIHALVAARLGDVELAEHYFRQAAAIDLANNMGNAAGGVHMAALGGLWQAAVFGFAGLRVRPDGLAFAPHLPQHWGCLRFPVRWCGRRLQVNVRAQPPAIEVHLRDGRPLRLVVDDGPEIVAVPGRRYGTRRAGAGWTVWQESRA